MPRKKQTRRNKPSVSASSTHFWAADTNFGGAAGAAATEGAGRVTEAEGVTEAAETEGAAGKTEMEEAAAAVHAARPWAAAEVAAAMAEPLPGLVVPAAFARAVLSDTPTAPSRVAWPSPLAPLPAPATALPLAPAAIASKGCTRTGAEAKASCPLRSISVPSGPVSVPSGAMLSGSRSTATWRPCSRIRLCSRAPSPTCAQKPAVMGIKGGGVRTIIALGLRMGGRWGVRR
mmetsp:Transcript_3886/g.12815  ORF Transcript_3886/g.12815 Transcript_3886/m.12815 type:complete len:232 (+) Transcript_3886:1673-2368(+)